MPHFVERRFSVDQLLNRRLRLNATRLQSRQDNAKSAPLAQIKILLPALVKQIAQISLIFHTGGSSTNFGQISGIGAS
jgi:hypothetical protein